MKFYFSPEDKNKRTLSLRLSYGATNRLSLTAGMDFDRLLIASIDKLSSNNRIDKTSLKSLEISGKIDPTAVSGMIAEAVASALRF